MPYGASSYGSVNSCVVTFVLKNHAVKPISIRDELVARPKWRTMCLYGSKLSDYTALVIVYVTAVNSGFSLSHNFSTSPI